MLSLLASLKSSLARLARDRLPFLRRMRTEISFTRVALLPRGGPAIKTPKTSAPSKTRASRCPKCGSERVVPIFYGLPPADLLERTEPGEIYFGVCCIEPDQPSSACRECGNRC